MTRRRSSPGLSLACLALLVLSLPLVAGAQPLVADAQPLVVDLGNGLALRAASLEPARNDAIRLEVGPLEPGAPVSDKLARRFGAVQVRYDPQRNIVTVEHDAGGRWVGRFDRLQDFGRASVPGLEIAWQAGEHESLYGLGERFDALDVAGREVEMWLVDQPGQGDGSATYFVTPVLYSSRGYGLFADDNPEGRFSLTDTAGEWHRYQRAGDSASFVLVFGEDVPSLIRARTKMIGGLEPAPAWAYAPWISKNSYETQQEAEAAMDGMQQRGLPFGVIVLEAWKGRSESGAFNRFSTERWPDVEGFLARCARDGVKVVLWQVPILHPSSPLFAEAKSKGYLVTDPAGEVSLREEWLAGFGNIDFLKPEAAQFWKDMLRPVVRQGIAGFKADDGEAIKPTDRLGHDATPGWQAHNRYSSLYNQATYELFAEEGIDGMLWARSGSLGIEQSPGLWAGDQSATWDQLQRLVTAGLSSSISGMPYWGHDIGGYFGEATPELYIRWLQLGALSPFMQFHGIDPREPWHFGDEAIAAYRKLANLRMNLRPALVALGDTAAATGMPIMRPMFFATGDHGDGAGAVDQYMLGEDMLVAPVMEEGAAGRTITFPAGRWLHALSPMIFEGPGRYTVPIGMVDAPLFIREGATLDLVLAEGQPPGTWSKDAPTRTDTVTPALLWGDRPSMTNLQAPLRGHPTGGPTVLQFEASRDAAESLRAQWWFTDRPDQVHAAAVQPADGGGYLVDLSPENVADAAGRRQRYRLANASGDMPLVQGAIDWNDLVRVEIDGPYRNVVIPGATTVHGSLTNRTGVATTGRLQGTFPEHVSSADHSRTFRLAPGETRTFAWPVDVDSASGAVGDSRVTFSATVDGAELDKAEAALIRSPRWLVAGPFPAESKTAGFAATTPAEWEFGPEARFSTRDGMLRWEAVDPQSVAEMEGLDFNALFGERENSFAYATTVIHSDREQPAQIRVGTDDTLSLWVNGKMLIAQEFDRPALPDQNVINVTLKQGENRLLIKVAQGRGGWALVHRITGPEGEPIEGVTDANTNITAYAAERPDEGRAVAAGPALDWRYLGPIHYDQGAGVQGLTAVERAIAQGNALPRSASGIHWRRLDASGIGWTDLKSVSRDDWVVVYCVAEFELDNAGEVELRCGSDDGLVVWIDDTRVIDAERPRPYTPAEDVARVHLNAGRHRVVARVSQGQGDWGFDVRLWNMSVSPPRLIGSGR